METQAVNTVLDGLLHFRASIVFTTTADPKQVVRSALDTNPKLVYYLQGYTLRGSLGRFTLLPRYANRDTSAGDIHPVSSVEECLQYMCHAVGNYKQQLIVVSRTGLDMNRVTDLFMKKHSPFYANFTSLGATGFSMQDTFTVHRFAFRYRIGLVKLNMMELQVDQQVERICAQLFTPDMPPEAKVYLAHNYLATTVTYRDCSENPLAASYTQSAYGALIRHQCVCQGFAEAFKRILDAAGVHCEVVCGQITGSAEYHAWNIVSLGGQAEYYHIDTTWDARAVRPQYTHFCRPDGYYRGKREWNRTLNPACTGARPVLSIARLYIMRNKRMLREKGIDPKILDC